MHFYIPLYGPAVFALLYKFYLLYWGRKALTTNRSSRTLLGLLIVMTICNAIEIIGYQYYDNPEAAELFLRVYYVSLVMMFAFLLQLAALSVFRNLNSQVDWLNFSLATLICFLLLFTNLLVAGAQSNGYSVTRVSGVAYWVVPSYAIATLLTSLGLIVSGYLKTNLPALRVQFLYLFLAIVSLIIPVFFAIAAMALGYAINAAFILPIGITFFLGFLTHAIQHDKLFDIRFWLPFTTRNKLRKAIKEELMVYRDGWTMSAKERKQNHEKVFILKMILDYQGSFSQKEIASKMGISESSLSRKLKEYGIPFRNIR